MHALPRTEIYRQKGFGVNVRKSRNGADQYACRVASDG